MSRGMLDEFKAFTTPIKGNANRSVCLDQMSPFSFDLPDFSAGFAAGFLFSQEAQVGRMLGFGWAVGRYSVKIDAENQL